MNKAEAKEALDRACHAVQTAAMLIKMEMPTIEAFLKESRDMQNFGQIIDPTLFNKSERRAVEALLKPTFESAVTFLKHFEAQQTLAMAALAKVKDPR